MTHSRGGVCSAASGGAGGGVLGGSMGDGRPSGTSRRTNTRILSVVLCQPATFGNIYDILSLLSLYMRAGTAKGEHWQQIDLRCCTFD